MKKYFSPSKLRWVLYIAFGEAIALFTILSIVFVILPFSSNRYIRGSDYVSYVTGAAIVRDGKGSTLYDIDTQTVYQRELVKPYRKQIILPYRYLPFLALFFVPFSWLDFRVGYFVYLGIQLLLVGLLSVFVIRIFRRVGRFVWAVLVPFSLLPISDSILWGQVTVFLTLVYFVFYWLETKGKSLLAGMVAGLFLIKPHLYLVGLPFWVLSSSRKKFFFFGNLLTVSVFLFISFFISGVGVFKYPDFLFLTEHGQYGSHLQFLPSLYSFLLFVSGNQKAAFLVNGVLFVVAFFLFWRRMKGKKQLSFVTATLLVPVFAIHTNILDLTHVLLAMFLLWEASLKQDGWKSIISLVFVILLYFSAAYCILGASILTPLFLLTMGTGLLFFGSKLGLDKEPRSELS